MVHAEKPRVEIVQQAESLTSVAKKVTGNADQKTVSRTVQSYMREGRAALQRSENRRVQEIKKSR